MSTPRLIPLTRWLTEQYGDAAPSLNTARRWCREDLIYPPAEKHGRMYFVRPDARYVAPESQGRISSGRLADRIREARHAAKAA